MKIRASLPYHGSAPPGTVLEQRSDAPLLVDGLRVGDVLAAVVSPNGDELLVDADVTDPAIAARLSGPLDRLTLKD